MADTVTEHPQYWAWPFNTLDELFNPKYLHRIEDAMHFQVDEIIRIKKPDKQAGYEPHIYWYRVTVDDIKANPSLSLIDENDVEPERFKGGYQVFGACYIVGALPESVTSRTGFKELPSKRPIEYQMIYQDDPTQREFDLAAAYIDQHAGKAPGYTHRLYQYRLRQGGRRFGSPVPIDCYVVATCCVAGDMPDDITSARDFKEIPWPLIQSKKNPPHQQDNNAAQ